ncbi:hypothetical protein STRA110950_05400 [Streptobacillus ratti]
MKFGRKCGINIEKNVRENLEKMLGNVGENVI